jgi:UDP-glucuronate decarboxylase
MDRLMAKIVAKRILVTSAAGFLGSHLCERLIARGDDVLCVDNYFTGRKDNIVHLLGEARFEAMRHDVTHPLCIEVDEIYNLACPASSIHYQFDPVQTTKSSMIGAINMLGLAKRVKAKIFQASTSEVYGDPTLHPQPESYRGNVNPIGPRACYDEGKRCAETLFFDYFRQHNLRPRMHPNDGRVVSHFIVQALNNAPITLCGDGTQTCAFCYVDGLIEGFLALMAADDDHRADKSRQSGRNLGGRARRDGGRIDGFALDNHALPAADRRSDPTMRRYRAGALGTRVGAPYRVARWPRAHHRLF